ncbi:hypothetical protein VH570_19715 [Sphingobium sp. HT1-2]|uniref:carph-isopro domain-containing protein n=1 Tax=Sphingobium sp. HT1-2 TaxID=3111640 RepID=UPI003BFC80C5
MLSVFQKFGGIRPMAAKIDVPPSTVKSWHTKREIPEWRRGAILAKAKDHGITLCEAELITIPADAPSEAAA